MPAIHNIDHNNRLIVTAWQGEAHDDELIEAMERYQQDIQSDPKYAGYNEVLDFSGVTKIKVSVSGIKEVGRIASKTDRSSGKRKLAIIAPSNITYYFARMYKALRSLSSKSNKNVNVFSKENEAMDWVKG